MISIDDAMEAVATFELMQYFNTVSSKGRVLIAEELMSMINWPPDKPLTDGSGHVLPYVEPRVRLARLLRALKTVSVWTSIADIRALYCQMYKPADEIEPPVGCGIPGFTMEECETGSDYLSLEHAESEQKFIPGPDDEPCGDLALIMQQVIKQKFGESERDCTCEGEAVNPGCSVHAKVVA